MEINSQITGRVPEKKTRHSGGTFFKKNEGRQQNASLGNYNSEELLQSFSEQEKIIQIYLCVYVYVRVNVCLSACAYVHVCARVCKCVIMQTTTTKPGGELQPAAA